MSFLKPKFMFLTMGVALAYFLTARFGLLWTLGATNASPLWLPAGIAFAAMLGLTKNLWPGIFIGAFIANGIHFYEIGLTTTSALVLASSMIAVGNSLEAWVGANLCQRLIGRHDPFDRAPDVIKFVFVSGLASVLSSTTGILAMFVIGAVSGATALDTWLTWWLGDTLAILIFCPFLLSWRPNAEHRTNSSGLELTAALGALLLLTMVIFYDWVEHPLVNARPLLVLPSLLWISFRFSRRELSTAIALISILAIHATSLGLGPFVSDSLNESLLSQQFYVAVVSITMVILTAALTETQIIQKQLKLANDELQKSVMERTQALERKTRILEAINNQLRIEAHERQAMEIQLRNLQDKYSQPD